MVGLDAARRVDRPGTGSRRIGMAEVGVGVFSKVR